AAWRGFRPPRGPSVAPRAHSCRSPEARPRDPCSASAPSVARARSEATSAHRPARAHGPRGSTARSAWACRHCSATACWSKGNTCFLKVVAASLQASLKRTSERNGEMVATERRKWLALALLSAVQFMVVLDIAVVNVALPSIKNDLGFSQDNLQWVISAYALVFGGFLLLGGRAADLLGRRRIFLVGLAVFTVASLLAGLAWSEASLIGARLFQGLGAAII